MEKIKSGLKQRDLGYLPESHSIPLSPAVPYDPSIQRFGIFGYAGPYDYTGEYGWKEESMSWRETCYIGDWTSLNEIRITGPDAFAAMAWCFPCGFQKFEVGRSKHGLLCFDNGHVMTQGILMRHGENEFEFQYGGMRSDYGDRILELSTAKGYNITVEHTGVTKFKFQVQGPNSLFALEKATGESLRDIRFMTFRHSVIAGHDVVIMRQGMSGDLGYEVQGDVNVGQEVYKVIYEAGKEYGMKRLGERVRMLNHTLAGLLHEMCRRDYTPFESGDLKSVVFDHDFHCRAVLEEAKANQTRGLVVLKWNSEDVMDIYASYFRTDKEAYRYIELPCHGGLMFPNVPGVQSRVLCDGKDVGICFSPKYDYETRTLISNAIISLDCHEPGTELTIVWGDEGKEQKLVRAVATPAPYFKSPRRYMDVTTLPSYL